MPMIGTKTPEEVKDYSLDWSKDIGTDSIANSTWTIVPSSANIASSIVAASGTMTTVWIADGIPGQVYVIENTIITSGGRELAKTFRLLVVAHNYI